MGDAVVTTFDRLVVFAVFVGVPAALFGLPLCLLFFLRTRLRKRIHQATQEVRS